MHKFFKQRDGWLYIAPALLLYTLFTIVPFPILFITATQEHNAIISLGSVGFANFVQAFQDKTFWVSHFNTYISLAVTLFVTVPLCLLYALVLDRTKATWLRNFFKFGVMLPSVLSVAVMGQLYKGFLEPKKGIINTLLNLVGLEEWALAWLSRSDTAIWAIIGVGFLFGGGITVIMFYAAIKAIPPQYYEAASIDGANFWQASVKITIPMLQDIMKYILVTSVVGSLCTFELIQVLTNGGPNKATYTVILYIKNTGFSEYNFGYACAMAVLFFFECVIISFTVNKITDKEPLEY